MTLKAPARNSITIAKRTQLFPPSSPGSGSDGGEPGAGVALGLVQDSCEGGGAAAAGGGLAAAAGAGAAWAAGVAVGRGRGGRWPAAGAAATGAAAGALVGTGGAGAGAAAAGAVAAGGGCAGWAPCGGMSVGWLIGSSGRNVRSFPATIFPRRPRFPLHVVRHVAARRYGFVANGTGPARARPGATDTAPVTSRTGVPRRPRAAARRGSAAVAVPARRSGCPRCAGGGCSTSASGSGSAQGQLRLRQGRPRAGLRPRRRPPSPLPRLPARPSPVARSTSPRCAAKSW